MHGAMVVKSGSRTPCDPGARDLLRYAWSGRRGSTRTRRYTPRHVAGGVRRRRRTRARRRAERSSAGPPRPALGAPERAAARSSATPDGAGPRAPPARVGGRGSAPRSRRCSRRSSCWWRSAPSGGRHRSPLPPPVVTNPGDVVDYAVAERVGTAVAAERRDGRRRRRRHHEAGGFRRRGRARTGSSPPRTTSTAPPRSW